MAVKISYKPLYIKIFDYKPNSGASVNLIYRKTGLCVGSTVINNKGYFEFFYPKGQLEPGLYDVKFYGGGLIEDYQPEGSWETIEIRDANLSIAVSLYASPGAAVKFQNGVYIPDEVSLTVNTYNIYTPQYKWYKDLVLIPNETSDVLIVDPSVDLDSSSTVSYKCEITGINLDGEQIEPRFVTTNLVKYVDGESGVNGPGIAYRGIYNQDKTYISTNILKDVVYYDGYYYICNHDGTTGVWNPAYWDTFGANFESVATGLLLAEDAIITKTLTLGEVGNSNFGIIKSANVTDIDTGQGFYLAADDSSELFRVGDANQFIKWDGSALRVKSTYFDLTTDGTLWASSGGFGGTVLEPKLVLNTNGLKTGETYIHGTNSWTAPTTTIISNSNIGTSWNLTGSGSLATSLITLNYTDTTAGPNKFTEVVTSGGWSTFTKNGLDITSAITSTPGAYFRTGQITDMYLEAGYYKISFTLTKNSGTGSFRWRLSTSASLSTQAYAGTDQTYSTSGTYTYYINVTTPGTYYWGCSIGLPGTANFSVTNIYIGLDGVVGPEANSFVYFTEQLSALSVGKIYEFKGLFEGTGEPLKKHTFKAEVLIDNTVVKTVNGYKYDGIIPSPFSVTYTNTASNGVLMFKITYTGIIDQATTLPDLTE